MNDFLHVLFSAYVVFTIFDVHRASCQFDTHKFMVFDKPTKSWLHYFIIQQAWSIGSLAVVALVAWVII